MTKTIWIVIAVVVVLGVGYWLWDSSSSGTLGFMASSTPSTTVAGTDNTNGTTGGSATTAGGSAATAPGQAFINGQYGYTIKYFPAAPHSTSVASNVTFGAYDGTMQGTLSINVSGDLAHNSYCLTEPAGSTGAATTTIAGQAFLKYVSAAPTGMSGTATYYKALRRLPSSTASACYSIVKYTAGSSLIDEELNAVLGTLSFKV